MLSLTLDPRHLPLPEVEAPPDDDAAFFRGVTIGVTISVALYALLFLAWKLA